MTPMRARKAGKMYLQGFFSSAINPGDLNNYGDNKAEVIESGCAAPRLPCSLRRSA